MRTLRYFFALLIATACGKGAPETKSESGSQEASDPVGESQGTKDPASKNQTEGEPSKVTDWKKSSGSVDKIVYHFQDSSVPPPHHRSFTLTITNEEITKVVDSYGDIISEQANALTEEQFASLLKSLDDYKIVRQEVDNDQPGCAGGTGHSLTIFAGSEKVFEADADSCGGKISGSLGGDIKGFANAANSLIIPSADGLPTRPKKSD